MKSPFKKCIGIDPGKGGGIAVLTDKTVKVYACPKTVKDMAMLMGICLKDVAAYRILSVYETDPILVTPKTWQSHFDIKKGLPKPVRKKILKQMAIDKCPETKGITLKTADALLIAVYGLEAVLSYENAK